MNHEALQVLAETVHTAFRKHEGAEGKESVAVHQAISDLPDRQWTQALEWMLWCFNEVGWELRKKPYVNPEQNKDLSKLLRAIAESQYAKESKHNILLKLAADELDHHRDTIAVLGEAAQKFPDIAKALIALAQKAPEQAKFKIVRIVQDGKW